MFWCFNCLKNIQSISSIKCQYCSSEAIEQSTQQSNAANFEPFVSQAENQFQQNNQSQEQNQSQSQQAHHYGDPMGMNILNIFNQMINNDVSINFRYVAPRPMIRIVFLNFEQQTKNPVAQQKISQLQKVQLHQQCAICQQKQGNGLKLPCKHSFHENCIKPWFENTNTCPCCRVAL